MGWIKTHLPDELHGKLKHYRDRHNHDGLVEAVRTCIVKELNRDEKENGKLSSDNPTEHPTWNND
jgi:hypothetical protein